MKMLVRVCFPFVVSFLLHAGEGEEVYLKKCASCHEAYIPMTKLMENFVEQENKLLKLKAPTVNQLSYRLKQQIGDPKGDEDMHRMEVAAFVSDYLKNPDKEKSICLPNIIKYFETMPSMKGQLNEDEMEAVSEFIYEYETKLIEQKSVAYVSFDMALKKAAENNKIIMIKATSKHCHYCKKMDREVFVEPEVVQVLQKDFISLSVDVGKDTLPLGLKAVMTPTFFFINKEKKVIKTIPGAWSKEDFLEILKEAKIEKRSQK